MEETRPKRQRTANINSIPVLERTPLEIFYIIAKNLQESYVMTKKYYVDKYLDERNHNKRIIDKIRDLIDVEEDIDVECIHDNGLCPAIMATRCDVCFDQCAECECRVSIDEIVTLEIGGDEYSLCDACQETVRLKLR